MAQHVDVYYEPGRYGGWPANHGIWSWGDEILVGFSKGYYKDLGDRHHIDREKPELHEQPVRILQAQLDAEHLGSVEPVDGFLVVLPGHQCCFLARTHPVQDFEFGII